MHFIRTRKRRKLDGYNSVSRPVMMARGKRHEADSLPQRLLWPGMLVYPLRRVARLRHGQSGTSSPNQSLMRRATYLILHLKEKEKKAPKMRRNLIQRLGSTERF